jgi:Arc/MetJ family transcription regulator
MIRRTTIEIDDELLARAKRALGSTTTRATVEEALARVARQVEDEKDERGALQREYLAHISSSADLDVLRSEDMWR